MKPSPTQAIFMRAMLADDAYVRVELNRHDEICEVIPYGFSWRVLPTTLSVCVENGWIEKIVENHETAYGYKYSNIIYKLSDTGKQVIESLSESDFVPQRPCMTAKEVLDVLKFSYPDPEWIFIPEMRMGSGCNGYSMQRIDAWALNTFPSSGHTKIAFEIKVYRSDFLKEIAHPEKRIPAMTVSEYFYFVTLEDVTKLEEIPDDCGWIVVKDKCYVKKKAPLHKCEQPSWSFISSLFRRVEP